MDRESFFCFCLEKYGVEPDYPFDKDLSIAVMRHGDNRKWFAVAMNVPVCVFGLRDDRRVEIVNLKADPMMIGSLIRQKGIYPAYHMAKGHWISLLLDGSACEDTVMLLTDVSFSLTANKKCLKRKEKTQNTL